MEIDINELEDLRREVRFLNCLMAAGVDSWEGYEYAQELYDQGEG